MLRGYLKVLAVSLMLHACTNAALRQGKALRRRMRRTLSAYLHGSLFCRKTA